MIDLSFLLIEQAFSASHLSVFSQILLGMDTMAHEGIRTLVSCPTPCAKRFLGTHSSTCLVPPQPRLPSVLRSLVIEPKVSLQEQKANPTEKEACRLSGSGGIGVLESQGQRQAGPLCLVKCFAATVLAFLIILSFNLCFASEIWGTLVSRGDVRAQESLAICVRLLLAVPHA